ncbi:hypothetical protein Ocin01_17925, partial [Orchesella cincta]
MLHNAFSNPFYPIIEFIHLRSIYFNWRPELSYLPYIRVNLSLTDSCFIIREQEY